jgi:hypothetical protein
VRVLRDGVPAAGRLISKVATGSSTNGRSDYRMTFEYTAQDGNTSRLTTRSNRPERLEDQSQELVLYDPANRESAFLMDGLPGSVTIDESGQSAPKRPWTPFFSGVDVAGERLVCLSSLDLDATPRNPDFGHSVGHRAEAAGV